jgi:hypothetical protein
MYIVISIIVIVIVLVLVFVVFAKKTSTPTLTPDLYRPQVHDAYNILVNTKYTDIQMKINILKSTISPLKSKNILTQNESVYLDIFELNLKTMLLIKPDGLYTSKEKVQILFIINQIIMITKKHKLNFETNFGINIDLSKISSVTMPRQTTQPMSIQQKLEQINKNILILVRKPMTPYQSEQIKEVQNRYYEILGYRGEDIHYGWNDKQISDLENELSDKQKYYSELQLVLYPKTTSRSI